MIHVTNCYLLIEIGTLLELLSCQNVCSASPLIPCYAATSWGETILEDILQLISTFYNNNSNVSKYFVKKSTVVFSKLEALTRLI